jgi:hypothetical protein
MRNLRPVFIEVEIGVIVLRVATHATLAGAFAIAAVAGVFAARTVTRLALHVHQIHHRAARAQPREPAHVAVTGDVTSHAVAVAVNELRRQRLERVRVRGLAVHLERLQVTTLTGPDPEVTIRQRAAVGGGELLLRVELLLDEAVLIVEAIELGGHLRIVGILRRQMMKAIARFFDTAAREREFHFAHVLTLRRRAHDARAPRFHRLADGLALRIVSQHHQVEAGNGFDQRAGFLFAHVREQHHDVARRAQLGCDRAHRLRGIGDAIGEALDRLRRLALRLWPRAEHRLGAGRNYRQKSDAEFAARHHTIRWKRRAQPVGGGVGRSARPHPQRIPLRDEIGADDRQRVVARVLHQRGETKVQIHLAHTDGVVAEFTHFLRDEMGLRLVEHVGRTIEVTRRAHHQRRGFRSQVL